MIFGISRIDFFSLDYNNIFRIIINLTNKYVGKKFKIKITPK